MVVLEHDNYYVMIIETLQKFEHTSATGDLLTLEQRKGGALGKPYWIGTRNGVCVTSPDDVLSVLAVLCPGWRNPDRKALETLWLESLPDEVKA